MSSRSRALARRAARAAAAASKEGPLRSSGATASSIRVAGGRSQSTLASSGPSASKAPGATTKPSGTRGAAASAMPAVQEVAEEAVASSSSSSAATSSSSSSSSSQFLPFARAHPVTAITTNVVGAVSPDDGIPAATAYRNEDGARIDDGRYRAFLDAVGEFVPAERVFQDPLRTFAYSTDASFYRLVPKAVIKVSIVLAVLGKW